MSLFPMEPREGLLIDLEVSHDEACQMIRGIVPHRIVVAYISFIKAMHETPAEGVESMRNKREARKRSAA